MLPDYLWGIETQGRRRRGRDEGKLPDYLWGIETLLDVVSIFAFVLPDYLWGIETHLVYIARGDFDASRLPMRNWNLSNLSIEIAYFNASRLPMRNWNVTRAAINFNFSFQTTYEELKLSILLKLKHPYSASRLPMRNWNRQARLSPSRKYRFQTTYEELKPRNTEMMEEL